MAIIIGKKIKDMFPQTASVGYLIFIGTAFCAISMISTNSELAVIFSIFPYVGLVLIFVFVVVFLLEIFSKTWPIVNLAIDFLKKILSYIFWPIRYIIKIVIKGAVMDIVLEMEKYGGIEIVEATYGTEKNNEKVTEDIKNKIENGKIDMLVLNNEFSIKDPDVGKVKTLEVTYKQDGKIITKKCDEYKRITIP